MSHSLPPRRPTPLDPRRLSSLRLAPDAMASRLADGQARRFALERGGRQVIKKLVAGQGKKGSIVSVGANGDTSVASTSTIIWADATNHAKTYQRMTQPWLWNNNIWHSFSFPGYGGYLVAFAGTDQAGDVTMTIDLLDANGAIVLDINGNPVVGPSMSVHYDVNLVSFSLVFTVSLNSLFQGSAVQFMDFNAIRINGTCSNTNLKLLINSGPLGISPNPSAFAGYPANPTKVTRLS